MAEFESDLIRERTAAGLAAARAHGNDYSQREQRQAVVTTVTRPGAAALGRPALTRCGPRG